MKTQHLLFYIITLTFFTFFVNIELSNAQNSECYIEILNSNTHCSSVDFSLLTSYQGDYSDISLEIYIDNEFVDYLTTSPWNWNDTEDYFNNLEAGNHYIDIISYNGDEPVCSAGKVINLLNDCGSPNPVVMWCDIDFSSSSINNIFCENNPPLIYTEVSAYTDIIMLFLDNEPVGTQIFPQSIYTSNSESLKILWNSEVYEKLSNLTLGMHTLILHTENANTGYTCSSEVEFILEECEDSESGITLEDGSKYKLDVKVFLEAFYDSETETMTNLSFQKGLIPEEQPFANSYYKYYNSEQLDINNTDIVDWVLVTLRTDDGRIMEKKAGLLLKDGTILDPKTNEVGLTFNSNSQSSYCISVAHRSHLAVLSLNPISSNSIADFTQENFTKGVSQTNKINDISVLIPGDLDGNGIINNMDYNVWAVNSAGVNIYGSEDVDGNGIVNNLDYNKWANNREKVGSIELLENTF